MAHEIWRDCGECGGVYDMRAGECECKTKVVKAEEVAEARNVKIKRDRAVLGYRNRLLPYYRHR